MATFFAIALYLVGGALVVASVFVANDMHLVGGIIIVALGGIFEMLYKIRALLKRATEKASAQPGADWPHPKPKLDI